MRVTVFGAGYVGLVTGACLADLGHDVVCVDVNVARIKKLNGGELPLWEQGLQAIMERNVAQGALQFTTEAIEGVDHGDVQFIAVGTPAGKDGAPDLYQVLTAVDAIAAHLRRHAVIVIKSTVPVGTADMIARRMSRTLAAKGSECTCDVVSNPEFLREGAAVSDFLNPDRIIIGTESERACMVMRELYEPFNRNHDCTICMDPRSAELTKYAANALLATKISFINEIANITELLGGDVEQVRKGVGADRRIGYHFIYPGLGYGGSCFPKDLQALARSAREVGYHPELIGAVEAVNNRQKTILFAKLVRHFGGTRRLHNKTIAIWGLAFKPHTSDMREAPSGVLIEALWKAGARLRAFDPVSMDEALRVYGRRDELVLCDNKYSALDGADALAICTEWPEFRAPDFDEMRLRLKSKTIFDGRNMFSPDRMKDDNWTYYSIGRGPVLEKVHLATATG